jgi:molybdopterin-guanine dinucleotide biosynthesis protein A
MNISHKNANTIGLVLAGGLSTRMGQDKALLQIEAQSMITRTSKVLEGTSVRKIVVSRNDGAKQHFADILPSKGPLSGIHSIATHFPEFDLLVVPVDLPLLDSATLQMLIDSGEGSSKNTRFKKENLPLFIHNSISFRQALNDTLTLTKNFSLGELCAQFPLLELTNPIPAKVFNTNTPEEWRFAKQHFNNNDALPTFGDMHESFK